MAISCDMVQGWGRLVAELDSAAVMRATRKLLVVRGDGSQCDQRPVVVERGRWTGLYKSGFEQSDFAICGDTTRRIWIRWKESAYDRAVRLYPKGARPAVPGVLMTVIGTLEGPGHYGHLGVATHELLVDSVVRLRPRRASDCR